MNFPSHSHFGINLSKIEFFDENTSNNEVIQGVALRKDHFSKLDMKGKYSRDGFHKS